MPPAKLPFDEWVKSMSFMIDDDFDNEFFESIEPIVEHVNQYCPLFCDPDTLEQYLMEKHKGIDTLTKILALVTMIGLSQERLKRVSSLIRLKYYNEKFNTEWSLKRICREIVSDQDFRNLLIDFFVNGRNSMVGASFPLYYMKNFSLNDKDFINALSNKTYVKRVLNDSEFLRKYSNSVGNYIEEEIVQKRLNEYKAKYHIELTYDAQKEFPLLNKNIDLIIPSLVNPKLLIEISYMITTGSGQSKRADQLVGYFSTIMQHNANHLNKKIHIVNYCDGLGWVGRQRDLNRIYEASDHVLNQSHIHLLDEIIAHYFN